MVLSFKLAIWSTELQRAGERKTGLTISDYDCGDQLVMRAEFMQ